MRSGKQAGLVAGFVLMILGCGLPAALADTLYVNGTTGNDAWDGRCETWDDATCGPKATIQAGIDAAVAGDEVVVADGTYRGLGNKNLDFLGKAIMVRSASGDPALCAIDCEGDGRGFYFHSGEGANSIVAGLEIVDGRVDDWSPAGSNGGGVCCDISSPTIITCMIIGNSAHDGGGIWCLDSSPTIVDTAIVGNTAVGVYSAGGGGGVCCSDGSPTFTSCTIRENRAIGRLGQGGGIQCADSDPTITNCTIVNNAAAVGGAFYCYSGSSPKLTNCTIISNTVDSQGAGFYCLYGCSPLLANCILWGNKPDEIHAISSNPVLTYCDIRDGWSGEGNIDVDPQFAFSGDFHLMPGSPCVDAGTNTPIGGLPAFDPDGNLRTLDGNGDTVSVADMGVYEFNSAVPTIATHWDSLEFRSAEGGGSPPDQPLWLRNSGAGTLNWEISGQPAWLTVTPSGGASTWEVDTVTLSVDSGGLTHGKYRAVLDVIDPAAVNSPRTVAVTLYVAGTRRVPSAYPTIQAAIDKAIPGDVVEIADGRYSGRGNKDLDLRGKAITVRSASGDPALCIVDCEYDGRGFYFHRSEGTASAVVGVTIKNGYIDDDSLGGGNGGGVCCVDASSPTFTDCVISGNTSAGAYAGGGGVFCYGYSDPMFVNCTIASNTCVGLYGGGGVCCHSGGSPMLTNCTITRNTTVGWYGGGGVCCCDSISRPTIVNCILWGDTPEEIGVRVNSPTVSRCDVQGGWAGDGNIDADPLFVDPDGPDNDPNTWPDNNYRLSPDSPCVDVGNNAAVPPNVLFDLDGQPRITDGNDDGVAVVDMGAYERPATIIGDLNCDGVVDFGDINPFVDVLMGLERYAAKYPGCDYRFADCNGDGVVDFGDINPFIDLLMGR